MKQNICKKETPQDLQSILYAEVEKILREEQEEEKKQQEKLQESA